MKNKIMSILLVISMLSFTCFSTFAETLDDKGLDSVINENIEQIEETSSESDVDLDEEILDADLEQKNEVVDGDNEIKPIESVDELNKESSELIDEIEEKDGVIEENNDGENAIVDTVVEEDNSEQVNEAEQADTGVEVEIDTKEKDEQNDEVISEERHEAEISITNASENENDAYSVDADTQVLDLEDDEAQEGSKQEGQLENKEEQKEVQEKREPRMFALTPSLSLSRDYKDTYITAQSFIENDLGFDMKLIGVLVYTVNDWTLVDESADFINGLANSKEFRLHVANTLILDEGLTYFDFEDIIEDGESQVLNVFIEMGPFTDALNEGLFSLQLVFEEIIPEVEDVPKESTNETELAEQAEQSEQSKQSEEALSTDGKVVEDEIIEIENNEETKLVDNEGTLENTLVENEESQEDCADTILTEELSDTNETQEPIDIFESSEITETETPSEDENEPMIDENKEVIQEIDFYTEKPTDDNIIESFDSETTNFEENCTSNSGKEAISDEQAKNSLLEDDVGIIEQ